jgi:thiol-disulfide isomerase/thioredoxin
LRLRITILFGLVFFWLLSSFDTQDDLRVLSFDDLEPHLYKSTDSLYIINFWATWCTPCVEEIPDFMKIHEQYADKKVKLLLVSLDFPKHIDSRVIPFLEKNKVTAEVLILDDPDANKWINKVDNGWSGSIPATLFYQNDKRIFIEDVMTYDDINKLITQNFTLK